MNRLTKAVAASLLATLVLVVGPAAVVLAQEQPETQKLSIRKVDSRDPNNVQISIIYNGARGDLNQLTLRENGKELQTGNPQPLRAAGVNVATVFVVDNSRSMGDNGGLKQAQESIRKIIEEKKDLDAIGIVGFGTEERVYTELTSDKATALAAVDEMRAPGDAKTALWRGVKAGSTLLRDLDGLQPNLVLITDGFNDIDGVTATQAKAELVASGAAAFILGYNQQKQLDKDAMQELVDAAGGRLVFAPRAADLDKGLKDVQTALENQYVINYNSDASAGVVDIEVSAGGATDAKSYVLGSEAQGNSALTVEPGDDGFLPDFLANRGGLMIIVAVAGLAVGLGAFALALLMTRNDTALQAALRPYSETFSPDDPTNDGGMVQTAIIQRAVDLTEEFAERQGFLSRVETMLEQADLPLRAAEVMFGYAIAVFLAAVLGVILIGPVGFLIFGLLAALLPFGILSFLAKRRQKAFESQLPDTLQLLSGSLRAGYSLMQGVEAVSQEVSEPMGKELRRVVTEARLGRELEEALDGVGDRMGSADFAWAVMAIRIQREVGGNLSELLQTVGETMVARERLRRDVSALTAEGRISAVILGLLPVGLGIVMYAGNPDYMGALFSERMGQVLLAVATVSALIGFAWMRKTIQIEI